jgi:hypothetical protein
MANAVCLLPQQNNCSGVRPARIPFGNLEVNPKGSAGTPVFPRPEFSIGVGLQQTKGKRVTSQHLTTVSQFSQVSVAVD